MWCITDTPAPLITLVMVLTTWIIVISYCCVYTLNMHALEPEFCVNYYAELMQRLYLILLPCALYLCG
jgi:hypothetical protein